ncbi:Rha family phage regulatory protein [Salmonella enterica]|uniref:Rha family phage regulatory protein n=1 Tax=Salmonella enterica TaxID=28901 RepID=UPI000FB2C5D9|nr:transcriptional regulator [Salmonella enterica]EBQ9005146.1 transcriptional regulator [Salmonella enterica subsp. enterica serovar Blockley]EDT5580227.1 transcriptional regulator [Salmonella enterica subsp. enterica serovar Kokomlemle]EDT7529694.1 transcriptional regulator [Salmonella enterica subsp. enterica serovar Adelaide]EDX3940264.1 transcriptional regulator [Salmonella enterica subsp. enterica serovar Overschie]MIY13448.1 transcriptional regulator [Salmonella enterica subsp. enterica
MLNVAIENQNGWNYSASAPHKTGAGISTPNVIRAHNRASAVFLRAKHSLIRIMVGRMGPLSGGPGSRMTGSANPVRLTTHEISTSRGELINLSYEDAVMATTLTLSHPEVTIENGLAVTTSVAIAEFFGKQHHHVVQKIESLECSEQFLTRNFSRVKFEHRGNSYNAYQITKNGFVFLVMGFTGKKAAAFKEAYIAEFDRMENELHQNNTPPHDKIIQGDGRTLVIQFDKLGNIITSQEVPNNAWVCTLENFKFFLEQQGWTLINRNKIKSMTVEQLLSLK